MNSVEAYIRELLDIRRSGEAVKETSYYPPLSRLLNEIGKTLKPQVRCIFNIKNRGAGIPDAGLFTADQLRKDPDNDLLTSQLPARGAMEVKDASKDVFQIANSRQVLGYLDRYGQVLVTNYRDFLLLGRGADGKPVRLEIYHLAENETSFWKGASNPRGLAEVHNERFTEYLKRVMLYAAPLTKPEDVAWFLASYARDARLRIEQIDLPALTAIRSALEDALGLKFEHEKGEHFFRSTLVQTLFYGIFSAWVLWSKQHIDTDSQAHFDWKVASWSLHIPMIRSLFDQVATPTKLGPLGLVEVLDWAGAALNRVDRAVFFSKFEEDHAVQYFYEPFLEAFDPELRKDLGVWYTPLEVVQYMVARVDTVLREELDIEDGLADPRVYVLDPCCGTGTYLVEVLKRIAATLIEKGEDALSSYDIKRAAVERVFGFELLPAPFVVAHLQLGLLLQHFGIPLTDEKHERAGVYLTNSLTGWEPPDPTKEKTVQLRLAGIPELKEERDAAEQIKRNVPILVVLGNPPYNAFAGVSPKEEQGMVGLYKAGLISEWDIKKFNLDDLYVRFFRLAEHRIAEQTGKGIVCYISNFSYLSDPSFVVMRQRFLSEFDELWFDCMNGDSRGTGKLTPEGLPDSSIFSTEYNREGIRVGTVIGLMARKNERSKQPIVRFRQFWGVAKSSALLNSLNISDFNGQYQLPSPNRSNRFSFRTSEVSSTYLTWPTVSDLCLQPPFKAFLESRRGGLIDTVRDVLEKRMQMYYDSTIEWEELKALNTGLTKNAADFEARKVRIDVLCCEHYDSTRLRRYTIRPFETRWCYHSYFSSLWNRPRPELWTQCWPGNKFLVTRMKTEKEAKGSPLYFSSCLVDYQSLARNVSVIPLYLRTASATNDKAAQLVFLSDEKVINISKANLSPEAYFYLTELGITNMDTNIPFEELIWMHTLAIGYSSNYLSENADGIRQNWPRIPLPNSKDVLIDSAELGKKVALLLDTESSLPSATVGKLRVELKQIGIIWRNDGGHVNPNAGDLEVTIGWGHAGKNDITMPGKGKVIERDYTLDERTAIQEGAEILGLSVEQALKCLGETTCDVYLNNVAYWKNVPAKVWNYYIGGYQVIKKWLSYREHELLGRALNIDEAREVTNMARRITAILLLEPALDANYQSIKNSIYPWPTKEDQSG